MCCLLLALAWGAREAVRTILKDWEESAEPRGHQCSRIFISALR